jgi:murein DD-endopeptidase MepM/ murein hydrolase activator NlpD
VDWAATRGTPIMATGDGTVIAAGAHSGYGNRVEIQHANNYVTAYNHMARIARNVVPGAHVRLGQVIGAVGTTGLSTGPHVHYEVAINGRFVDPMKIRLPSARELTGATLAAFRQTRDQVDTLRRQNGVRTAAARM